MITKIEILPNEILLQICSYLEWFDMLTSFWSLNIRFNSLVCSILSINDNRLNSGLIITHGLSYAKCCSILFPLVFNSSSLCNSIQRIHLDGANSIACDLGYEWLFDDKKILRFPNLKTLILTRCGSIELVAQCLSYLIKHQLDELTLTFDEYVFKRFHYIEQYLPVTSDKEKQQTMLKQLLSQLFSSQCRLTSLRLDISNDYRDGTSIQQCLLSNSNVSSNFLQYQLRSCCMTLRYLHIRLNQTFFFHNLIQHVPNLEQMSVQFDCSLSSYSYVSTTSNIQSLSQSNENWFNKLPKLRDFSLKTFIDTDLEFIYLKWLLNNLNYVEKLEVHLKSYACIETKSQHIWKSFIDANFIRQYCLPDTTPNLIDFNFYICSECELSYNNIERIINSFKIHPFFISHQWTNVKCWFDRIISCQHLFSSFTNKFQFSHYAINHSYIFNWPYIDNIFSYIYPSLYLFLEQFNEIFPNISYIKVYKKRGVDFNKPSFLISLEILSKMRQYNGLDFPFRNVTKIQFGTRFDRSNATYWRLTPRDEIREKVLAHLISMTEQLKYLQVEQFEWLLHAAQYASNELRTNALITVRYAEFCLPSCHRGYETVNLGKHLVPFLSTYMPHLQTLRLWRPDDFPWTSIRPVCKGQRARTGLFQQWLESLATPNSIAQHAAVFQQDLCQLLEKLPEFTFLDIHGEILYEKVESYRSMVQARFPNSRINVEIARFRLWL